MKIAESEYELTAIRSSGPGGQHANKVATAIQLRFDINTSSLPDEVKERLLKINDHRITDEGIVIIKSTESRSQLKNKEEAIRRLEELITKASKKRKKRKKTKPTKGSIEARLQAKAKKSEVKKLRQGVDPETEL